MRNTIVDGCTQHTNNFTLPPTLFQRGWGDAAFKLQIASNIKYSQDFYESKIHTMKFYFKYEVPKTVSLALSLMDDGILTIKQDKEYIL